MAWYELQPPFAPPPANESWWPDARARLAALVPEERGAQRTMAESLLAACMVLATLALAAATPSSSERARLRGAAPDPLSVGSRPTSRPVAPGQGGPAKGAPALASPGHRAAGPRASVHVLGNLSGANPAVVSAAARRGALPVGKGMWLYVPDRVEGGNADGIAARAQALGLTHVYVRLGSSIDGFNGKGFLDRLLPAMHRSGIRVYGWDFPYLDNADADVERAIASITYQTPSGDRIDGFAADIELRSMGVNISPVTATVYGDHLRRRVGTAYPLVAVVPRPSAQLVDYPFDQVVNQFDAIAPMVYWLNRDPVGEVVGAIDTLRRYNKPILPIGQAYDGFPEGGPRGVPGRDQLLRFMQAAEERGAVGVSWWSWQHADQQAFDAIRDAPQFVLPAVRPGKLTGPQVRAYQVLLASVGYPVTVDGLWGPATARTVMAYQEAAHLPVTAMIDEATRRALLTPVSPPIQPS